MGQCVSGLRSCILVPELGVAFDFGFQFDQALSQASVICVTHGHCDHIGCLHYSAFDRRMHRLSPPLFLMPPQLIDAFRDAHHAYARLNQHPAMGKDAHMKNTFTVEAATGNSVRLQKGGGSYVVRAFKTIHGVPSVAYCIYQCSNRLLDEYVGMEGRKIGELRRAGTEVTRPVETPIIAYTGDSTIEGIVRNPDLLQARILVMECTYLDPWDGDDGDKNDHDDDDAYDGPDTPGEARKRKHVHEQHIVERAELFKNVQHLVLCHFSRRYRSGHIQAAVKRVQAALGDAVRVHAFIK